MVKKEPVHLVAKGLGLRKVADADGAPRRLIIVGRADAAACGADLALTSGLFPSLVQVSVKRQDGKDLIGIQYLIKKQSMSILMEDKIGSKMLGKNVMLLDQIWDYLN